MGLLDAYEDSANTALKVMDSRPVELEKPKPKHSAWSAPLRAVAAAGAEVLGNVVDTAAAAGQVAASVGGITPGFDDQKSRRQSIEAMDTLKQDGINWRTDESQQAYKFGADLRPDPLTAGTAENLVFSLTKGLTKAIGAAATLGPVAGAAAFGGSEGMTASEDLATQGVDLETRAKVGLVTAGFNAAGVALPVAGQTLKQTAGLVLAGGPASFMAQQQATRSILEAADYGEIAQQYDPLDPVGLTVSTLLPAGFAAYAKRGGFGNPAVPQEAVDAAMVQNLTAARDARSDATGFADQTLSSIDAFAADAKQRVINGLMADRAELARVASGELTETEAGRASSRFRTNPDEAKARILEIDALISEAETRYAPTDETMQAAYQMHRMRAGMDGSQLPTVKDDLTVQPVAEVQTPDAYAARVDALTKEQPDLIARLDESGRPVKLSDELAAIKKEAQEGTDTDFGAMDAPLLKVAAECALSIGTAGL